MFIIIIIIITIIIIYNIKEIYKDQLSNKKTDEKKNKPNQNIIPELTIYSINENKEPTDIIDPIEIIESGEKIETIIDYLELPPITTTIIEEDKYFNNENDCINYYKNKSEDKTLDNTNNINYCLDYFIDKMDSTNDNLEEEEKNDGAHDIIGDIMDDTYQTPEYNFDDKIELDISDEVYDKNELILYNYRMKLYQQKEKGNQIVKGLKEMDFPVIIAEMLIGEFAENTMTNLIIKMRTIDKNLKQIKQINEIYDKTLKNKIKKNDDLMLEKRKNTLRKIKQKDTLNGTNKLVGAWDNEINGIKSESDYKRLVNKIRNNYGHSDYDFESATGDFLEEGPLDKIQKTQKWSELDKFEIENTSINNTLQKQYPNYDLTENIEEEINEMKKKADKLKKLEKNILNIDEIKNNLDQILASNTSITIKRNELIGIKTQINWDLKDEMILQNKQKEKKILIILTEEENTELKNQIKKIKKESIKVNDETLKKMNENLNHKKNNYQVGQIQGRWSNSAMSKTRGMLNELQTAFKNTINTAKKWKIPGLGKLNLIAKKSQLKTIFTGISAQTKMGKFGLGFGFPAFDAVSTLLDFIDPFGFDNIQSNSLYYKVKRNYDMNHARTIYEEDKKKRNKKHGFNKWTGGKKGSDHSGNSSPILDTSLYWGPLHELTAYEHIDLNKTEDNINTQIRISNITLLYKKYLLKIIDREFNIYMENDNDVKDTWGQILEKLKILDDQIICTYVDEFAKNKQYLGEKIKDKFNEWKFNQETDIWQIYGGLIPKLDCRVRPPSRTGELSATVYATSLKDSELIVYDVAILYISIFMNFLEKIAVPAAWTMVCESFPTKWVRNNISNKDWENLNYKIDQKSLSIAEKWDALNDLDIKIATLLSHKDNTGKLIYNEKSEEIKILNTAHNKIQQSLNITTSQDCTYNIDDMMTMKGGNFIGSIIPDDLKNIDNIIEEQMNIDQSYTNTALTMGGMGVSAIALKKIYNQGLLKPLGVTAVADYLINTDCEPKDFCENGNDQPMNTVLKLFTGSQQCKLKDNYVAPNFQFSPEEYEPFIGESCNLCYSEWTDWEFTRLLYKFTPDIENYNDIMETNINIQKYIDIVDDCYVLETAEDDKDCPNKLALENEKKHNDNLNTENINELCKIPINKSCIIDEDGFFLLSDEKIRLLKELDASTEGGLLEFQYIIYIEKKENLDNPEYKNTGNMSNENLIYLKELEYFNSEFKRLYDILINKKTNTNSRKKGKCPLDFCNKNKSLLDINKELVNIRQNCMYRHKDNCILNWDEAASDQRIPYHYWNPNFNTCVVQPNLWNQRTMCDCATKKGNGLIGKIIEGDEIENVDDMIKGASIGCVLGTVATKSAKGCAYGAAGGALLASGNNTMIGQLGSSIKDMAMCGDANDGFSQAYSCSDLLGGEVDDEYINKVEALRVISTPGSNIPEPYPITGNDDLQKQQNDLKKEIDEISEQIISDDNINGRNLANKLQQLWGLYYHNKEYGKYEEENERLILKNKIRKELENSGMLSSDIRNILFQIQKKDDPNFENLDNYTLPEKIKGMTMKNLLKCKCNIDIRDQLNPNIDYEEYAAENKRAICEGEMGIDLSNIPDRAVEWTGEDGYPNNMCFTTKDFCKETSGCWLYNEKLNPAPIGYGMMDCVVPAGQTISEAIFGTSVSRLAKKGLAEIGVDTCEFNKGNKCVVMGENIKDSEKKVLYDNDICF